MVLGAIYVGPLRNAGQDRDTAVALEHSSSESSAGNFRQVAHIPVGICYAVV